MNIFLQADRVFGLEIHVQLLAFAYFHGRPIESVHDPSDMRVVDAVQVIIGHHEHDISSQQGGRFSVFRVYSWFSSAQRCLIHDIVMDQREIMEEFYRTGQWIGIRENIIKKFVAHEAHQGSDPLASQSKKIGCRVVKTRRFYRKMSAVEISFKLFLQRQQRMHHDYFT